MVAKVLFALLGDFFVLKRPFEACPERAYYKTRNTRKQNTEHPRNIGTTEHHWNTKHPLNDGTTPE